MRVLRLWKRNQLRGGATQDGTVIDVIRSRVPHAFLLRVRGSPGTHHIKNGCDDPQTLPDVEKSAGAIHCDSPNCRYDWRLSADQNREQPLESRTKENNRPVSRPNRNPNDD